MRVFCETPPHSTVRWITVCGSRPGMPEAACRRRPKRCAFCRSWSTAGPPSTCTTGVLMLNWRKFVNAPESSLIECSPRVMRKYAADRPLAHGSVNKCNDSAEWAEHARPLQAPTTTLAGAGPARPDSVVFGLFRPARVMTRLLLLLALVAVGS